MIRFLAPWLDPMTGLWVLIPNNIFSELLSPSPNENSWGRQISCNPFIEFLFLVNGRGGNVAMPPADHLFQWRMRENKHWWWWHLNCTPNDLLLSWRFTYKVWQLACHGELPQAHWKLGANKFSGLVNRIMHLTCSKWSAGCDLDDSLLPP